jgi:hypothetical protein
MQNLLITLSSSINSVAEGIRLQMKTQDIMPPLIHENVDMVY